jgi:hypothetical protein
MRLVGKKKTLPTLHKKNFSNEAGGQVAHLVNNSKVDIKNISNCF